MVVIVAAFLLLNRNAGFSLVEKWENTGKSTFGQAQMGAIIKFDGTNCNLYSPEDTYAFYKENGNYYLDLTSYIFAETMSYEVKIINGNQIEIQVGSTLLVLTCVE